MKKLAGEMEPISDAPDKTELIQRQQVNLQRIFSCCLLAVFIFQMFAFFYLHRSASNEKIRVSASLLDLEIRVQKLKDMLEREVYPEKHVDLVNGIEKSLTRKRRSLMDKENVNLIYRTINFLFNQKIPGKCLQNSSIVCLPGKTGHPGPIGRKGERGLKGYQGQAGPVGPKGSRGIVGLHGERGERGERGMTGAVGPPGKEGPVGPKGVKGSRGPAGDTLQKPTIITRPESITVVTNASAKFTCQAEGSPTPKVSWLFKGEIIRRGDTRFQAYNDTLVLKEITEQDQGVITCLASSVLGNSKVDAKLYVLAKPVISIHPSNTPRYLTVAYGSDVDILCNATGYPKPTVKWQKMGVVSEDSGEIGRLVLKRVNEKNTGLYRCHAKNSVGEAAHAVLIFVNSPFRDCKHLYKEGFTKSSTYIIKPDLGPPFRVFCDMKTSGGGWVVFQRRNDSSTTFDRDWSAYKNGFGELNGNFWLGLDKIHRLTETPSTLRVDFDRESRRSYYRRSYASYSRFTVAGERENYRLDVSGYRRNNAGDSLRYHNGMAFSTKDRDNDGHGSINCAAEQGGPWWHKSCQYSALNAKFPTKFSPSSNRFMTWYTKNNRAGNIDFSEMKLRRIY